MARTKFRSRLQPEPVNPGDAPPVGPEPPGGRWSIERYPKPPLPEPGEHADDDGSEQ